MAGIDRHVLDAFSKRTGAGRGPPGRQAGPVPASSWAGSRRPGSAGGSNGRRSSTPGRPRPTSACGTTSTSAGAAELERLGLRAPAARRRGHRRAETGAADQRSRPPPIVDQALAALTEQQSTWRRNELVRELGRAVPTTLTHPAGELAGLARTARRRTSSPTGSSSSPRRHRPARPGAATDGPSPNRPLDRRFTTADILDEEARIIDRAERRLADGGDDNAARRRRAASTGPKPQVGGCRGRHPTARARRRPGRDRQDHRHRSAVALHRTWRAVSGWPPRRPPPRCWPRHRHAGRHRRQAAPRAPQLDPAPRYQLAAPARRSSSTKPACCPRRSWPSCRAWPTAAAGGSSLVGDPLQLSAVGRGGMFAHLVDSHGAHRARPGPPLRRRLGTRSHPRPPRRRAPKPSTPTTATAASTTATPTARATTSSRRWAGARAAGEDLAVLAATNEAARRLNASASRPQRLAAGELGGPGRQAAVRRSRSTSATWSPPAATTAPSRTDRGVMVRNRARWTVTAIDPDGERHRREAATAPSGSPPSYVDRHVELAYAETIHAAQGRTVDRALALIDGPIDGRALYVALTRGRRSNEVLVVADDNQAAQGQLLDAIARHWIDQPAVAIADETKRRLDSAAQARRRLRGGGLSAHRKGFDYPRPHRAEAPFVAPGSGERVTLVSLERRRLSASSNVRSSEPVNVMRAGKV